jgi:hypothetical protein
LGLRLRLQGACLVMTEKSDWISAEDYDVEGLDEPETRTCGECCGHWDSLNLCCWIVSERGLCTSVSEGDYCIYNFKENDGR